MIKTKDSNKVVYILTIEYDPKSEEIEFISEEIIDNKDYKQVLF